MGRKRNNGLSEEKRNIIGQLIVLAVKHRRSDYQVPGFSGLSVSAGALSRRFPQPCSYIIHFITVYVYWRNALIFGVFIANDIHLI